MATETNDKTPEVVVEGESENVDMRTENAGSTPLPGKENTSDSLQVADTAEPSESNPDEHQGEGLPSEDTAPIEVPPSTVEEAGHQEQENIGYAPIHPGTNQQSQQQLAPSINQMAIVASAQNKLPVSKVKGIVLRLGRHTESSGQKTGKWFKNENYVDKDSYTWKNMALFEDHQCHLWTASGTVRNAYKK